MKYKTNIPKKTLNVLLCSRNPVYGVSGGQENRLDVTNPHTERFFFKFEKPPRCGGLVQATFFHLHEPRVGSQNIKL